MNVKTKTLKISEWVHKELKLFSAKEGVSITKISDAAIVSLLTMKGHKFTYKPKKQKP
jgi:hypothetical protein